MYINGIHYRLLYLSDLLKRCLISIILSIVLANLFIYLVNTYVAIVVTYMYFSKEALGFILISIMLIAVLAGLLVEKIILKKCNISLLTKRN